MSDYQDFIETKTHSAGDGGFDPVFMPDILFPFQKAIAEWAIRKGRAAIFADCGLGKTFLQLTWAENVARHSGRRVLILTPLAVAFQTVNEAGKLGLEAVHRREGIKPGDKLVVTNYERLHYFNPEDFAGVVCDESSILKGTEGETRKAVTAFMRKIPYRLLCTATAAPNDYVELGTSSEALGHLGHIDMLQKFFTSKDKTFAQGGVGSGLARFKGQADRKELYRFRGHSEPDFWRWVCSWARAVRRPSDMGFEDGAFQLPELTTRYHNVEVAAVRNGLLFNLPAVGLKEQREDLRISIGERCEMAASLINSNTGGQSIAWCNLNPEGDRLAKLIKGAVQVAGKDPEEFKEETFAAFVRGEIKCLVTKPTIAGFGLNLQNCAHQTFFPSHSYEQFYQAVRRSWRFGQTRPVVVDMITTEGQDGVTKNLARKMDQASVMMDRLVEMMWRELRLSRHNPFVNPQEIPQWL